MVERGRHGGAFFILVIGSERERSGDLGLTPLGQVFSSLSTN